MRKGVTIPKREYSRYERLGGNRPGRNVCVSGRITDDMDDKMDTMAEKGDTTRSKIVSDALEMYIGNTHHKDITGIAQGSTTTSSPNTDSTLLTIVIQKDAKGMYVGIVPSIEGCHSCGETLDEVLVNLRKAINGD